MTRIRASALAARAAGSTVVVSHYHHGLAGRTTGAIAVASATTPDSAINIVHDY